jgi:hypothetical protein
MDRTKLIIGGLVVLGLLFFCGIGAGFTVGSGPPGNAPSNDTIRGLLEKSVSPQEMSIPCQQGGMIAVNSGASCTIIILPSDTAARRLHLRITQGHMQALELTLRFPSPQTPTPPITMASHPTPAAELSLDIFREGASLAITCSGGTQCRMQIVQ